MQRKKPTGWKRGYVQVYTGEGKGKTTAALGLTLRAVGAGLRVFVGQFMKARGSSEWKAVKALGDAVTVRHYGSGRFVRGKPSDEDVRRARRGVAELRRVLAAGSHEVVIADEIHVAAAVGALTVEDVLALIEARPAGVELVLTGRGADARVLARADLVTEMRAVRHYYAQGVRARRGIET